MSKLAKNDKNYNILEKYNFNDEDLKNHHAISIALFNKKNEILIMDHVKFNIWTIPMGKVKPEETVEEGLLAEMKEELDIVPIDFKEIKSFKRTYPRQGKKIKVIQHIFVCRKWKGTIKNKEPNKHRNIKFVSISDLKKTQYNKGSDATKEFLKWYDKEHKNMNLEDIGLNPNIPHNGEIILEYVVPKGMSLKDWLIYRKKHKLSAKDYHKKYPKSKWKVVHSNPKQRGEVVNGMGDMTYEKASAAHKAIMISKLRRGKMILETTYTPEMEKHFINRTNMHIGLVKKWAKKIYDYAPKRFSGLTERCKQHDSSKFKSPEKEPYVIITWQYKCKREGKEYEVPEELKEKLNAATTHHVLSNKHHPECSDANITQNSNIINKSDRDKPSGQQVDATNMSDIDIAEMIADWLSVSEERGTNPKDWANSNINTRWKFSQHQIDIIYELIHNIWDKVMVNNNFIIEQTTPTIYCDLDSVLVDLKKGVKDKFGLELFWGQDPKIKSKIFKKISEDKNFWSELPEMPDAMKLWNAIKEYNPNILTALPKIYKNDAIRGKREWVKKHLPGHNQIHTVERKEKINYAKDKNGNPNILIDDYAINIEDWEAAGGIGIQHTDAVSTIEKLKKRGFLEQSVFGGQPNYRNRKKNAPTFAYEAVYGKLPNPPLYGMINHPSKKCTIPDIGTIDIDEEIECKWIKKLNLINNIETRSSCGGHGPNRPTFIIFRMKPEYDDMAKQVSNSLNNIKGLYSISEIGQQGRPRIVVAGKTWIGEKTWKNWWEKIIEHISTVISNVLSTSVKRMLIENNAPHSYGCVMLNFELNKWGKITSSINEQDLYEGEGREDNPHVTILYGLHDDKINEIKAHLSENRKPIKVEVLGISFFKTDDYDVVKFDIESPQLEALNKKLRQFPHTNAYPEYKPHMTIAYVKPGCGKKYIQKFEKPTILRGTSFEYSEANDTRHYINLLETSFDSLLNNLDNPKSLYEWMIKHIKYGWFDPSSNKKISELTSDFITKYKSLSPSMLINKKIGTCIDQVIFEEKFFRKFKIEYKVIFIQSYYSMSHFFLTFKNADGWYAFETTVDGEQGIHGPFKDIDEITKKAYKFTVTKSKIDRGYQYKILDTLTPIIGKSLFSILKYVGYDFFKKENLKRHNIPLLNQSLVFSEKNIEVNVEKQEINYILESININHLRKTYEFEFEHPTWSNKRSKKFMKVLSKKYNIRATGDNSLKNDGLELAIDSQHPDILSIIKDVTSAGFGVTEDCGLHIHVNMINHVKNLLDFKNLVKGIYIVQHNIKTKWFTHGGMHRKPHHPELLKRLMHTKTLFEFGKVFLNNLYGYNVIKNIQDLKNVLKKKGWEHSYWIDFIPILRYIYKVQYTYKRKKTGGYGSLEIRGPMSLSANNNEIKLISFGKIMTQVNTLLSLVEKITKYIGGDLYRNMPKYFEQKQTKEDHRNYYIEKSDIHGKGIFANKRIFKDKEIGVALIKKAGKKQFLRTLLGRYVNHSDKPNSKLIRRNNEFSLIANKGIKKGQEITADYRGAEKVLGVKIDTSFLSNKQMILEHSIAINDAEKERVIINDSILNVIVLKTQSQLTQGLKHIIKLANNKGALFKHKTEETLYYTMDDVNIPLSIAFINKHNKVIDIQRMSPSSKHVTYQSAKPAIMALETNVNWFKKHGVKIGDTIHFEKAMRYLVFESAYVTGVEKVDKNVIPVAYPTADSLKSNEEIKHKINKALEKGNIIIIGGTGKETQLGTNEYLKTKWGNIIKTMEIQKYNTVKDNPILEHLEYKEIETLLGKNYYIIKIQLINN